MTNNWTYALFIKESSSPSFLPPKFRLPSGETRYSNNCSLDDILAAGYIGPIPQPPAPVDGKTYFWDSESNEWKLSENTNNIYQTKATILSLKDKINSLCCLCESDTITEDYRKKNYVLIGKLCAALHCVEHGGSCDNLEKLLSYSVDTFLSEKGDVLVLQNNWFSSYREKIKQQYEARGFVFTPYHFYGDAIDFPAEWSIGSGFIHAHELNENYVIPSGYKIIHILPDEGETVFSVVPANL